MLTFIKGFGVKAIAITVGLIITILVGTTVFYYKANNSHLVENGALKSDNVIMQQNEVFQESSAEITDQVVRDFVVDTMKANTATEKLRTESIHEYVQTVEVQKDGDNSKASDPNGDIRVAKLAKRLHDNYCRIRPEDPDCNPVNSVDGLRSGQGTK